MDSEVKRIAWILTCPGAPLPGFNYVAPYATLPGSPELTMDSSSPQPGLLEGGFVTSSTPDSFAVTRTESLDSGN
jgi:hypothetical protein